MRSPTRFFDGVTTVHKQDPLGFFGLPDPTAWHVWFDDFDDYLAANWVRTATGAGTTVINTGADGGILLTTNAAADDNSVFYQWSENAAAGTAETFKFVAGKKLFFKTRLQVSDVTQSDFVIGLQITDTTPLAVSDGVFFRKDDGDTNLNCVVSKASTASTSVVTGLLADATFIVLAFYYNGKDEVTFYANGAKIATVATTNLPDTEELTISFGVQNGEAVAKTMSIDYIFVAKERGNTGNQA